MKIVLRVKNLKLETTQDIIFDRSPLLIGRSRICDLTIDDSHLSRQHCLFEVLSPLKVRIKDQESQNGIFVDAKKVEAAELSVKQSFRMGDQEITLLSLDASKDEPALDELMPLKEPSLKVDLTLKTPLHLKPQSKPSYATKEWVQVSLFWKGEITDIQCFDRGDFVTIGESTQNDFTLSVPEIPKTFSFLKILPNGLEIFLHPSMTGVLETRDSVRSLDQVRSSARATAEGLSTFIQFNDRCLIEVGPFSLFVQSVRLNLTEPITAPFVNEPIYIGVVMMVSLVAFFIWMGLNQLPDIDNKKVIEQPVVQLEPPNAKPETVPSPPPPPPPPVKKEAAKKGPKESQKKLLAGNEGAGARAKGEMGKSGRQNGKIETHARPIGFHTSKPEIKKAPAGAFGDIQEKNNARAGLRPDQGTGAGHPKPKGSGTQAASKSKKKIVEPEDTGVLGALEGKGGGGKSKAGGVMAGQGLGGDIEGSIGGLERGSDLEARGNGGRGAKGIGLGGGGDSIEVGGLSTKGKGGGQQGFGLGSSGKKGEAEVSYSAEDVEVLDGLTRDEIERVVRAHEREVQACYEKALVVGGNTSLAGRLKVRWFVNQQGRAEQVSQESGISGGEGLFRCIADRIQTWQFPKPRGGKGAGVGWPWFFKKAQ